MIHPSVLVRSCSPYVRMYACMYDCINLGSFFFFLAEINLGSFFPFLALLMLVPCMYRYGFSTSDVVYI